MCVGQLGVGLDGLAGPSGGFAVKAVRADNGQTEKCAGVLRVSLQRLLKKVVRILVVESFVQQHSPAHPVHRILVRLRHGGAELVVGLIVQTQAPVPFATQIGIAAFGQRFVAGFCLRETPMLSEQVAVIGRGAPGHASAAAKQREQACPFFHSRHLSSSC
jgi:hypothetical protein